MELYARMLGNGPPIVLLHGLFGSNENFGMLARPLAEMYAVYAFDLRNHGRSPHADAMDYPSLAADVRETMSAHELDSAAVVGHSLGGKVAMELALSHPAAVDRLIALDIAPVAHAQRTNRAELEAMQALNLADIASRRDADAAMAEHLADAALRQFLLKNLVRGESGLAWRIPLEGIAAEYPRIAAAPSATGPYPGPALFLRGENSPYVRDDTVPAIHERFPRARIETIKRAGHWLHIEAPEATLKLIRAFLKAGTTQDSPGANFRAAPRG